MPILRIPILRHAILREDIVDPALLSNIAKVNLNIRNKIINLSFKNKLINLRIDK